MSELTYERAKQLYTPYDECQMRHLCALRDVEIDRLRVENAKLREYARKLLTGYECGRGELCEGCSWNGWDGDCNARMKARELGVEEE